MQSILAQPIGMQFDNDELEAELRELNTDVDVGNDDGGTTKPESDLNLPEGIYIIKSIRICFLFEVFHENIFIFKYRKKTQKKNFWTKWRKI